MSHRRRKGAFVWKTQLEAKVYEGSASCGAAGDLPLSRVREHSFDQDSLKCLGLVEVG